MKETIINYAKRLYLKFYTNPLVARTIANQFHRLYYYTPVPERTWHRTYWLGIPLLKCPFDLWLYQEILHQVRPDMIVECGTGNGGSALFFASICDLIDHGRVVTIDVETKAARPGHNRITYVHGSSIAPEVQSRIRALVGKSQRVMVVLDSDHTMNHVLQELEIYSELVTLGSYLIVEDTNINGHPVAPRFGPGPWEAVQSFLHRRDDFVIDAEMTKYYLSFNPQGYLKRIK